jgi:hypothetical protein
MSTFAPPHFTGAVAEATLLGLAVKVLMPVHWARTESPLDELVDPGIDIRFRLISRNKFYGNCRTR